MDVSSLNNFVSEIGQLTKESNYEKRSEVVEMLRTAMGSLSHSQLSISLQNAHLETLFECLGTQNIDEMESICLILTNSMNVLEPEDCLKKYHGAILEGFNHPNPSVRSLVISQLDRCLGSEAATQTLLSSYSDLIQCSINLLTAPELSVFNSVSKFISHLSSTRLGLDFITSNKFMGPIKSIIGTSGSTVQLRIYETLASLGVTNEKIIKSFESEGLLVAPLAQLVFKNNDPLAQMNALEILSIVAQSESGVEILDKNNVFTQVLDLCSNWKNDASSGLFFPGVLKFIGHVGVTQFPPEPLVDLALEGLLSSGQDFGIGTSAVEAVSFIATTAQGKNYIDNKSHINVILGRISELLVNCPSEFRSRIMDALSVLFSSGDDSEAYLSSWFSGIFPKIGNLFNLVQQPFPEIRQSSLSFLGIISKFNWAQKQILKFPGVVEYLVDRSVEPTKEASLLKYNIVVNLAHSQTVAQILSPSDLNRLKLHADQGPYYAEPLNIVAMESA